MIMLLVGLAAIVFLVMNFDVVLAVLFYGFLASVGIAVILAVSLLMFLGIAHI
jgi:hypothetical protein